MRQQGWTTTLDNNIGQQYWTKTWDKYKFKKTWDKDMGQEQLKKDIGQRY